MAKPLPATSHAVWPTAWGPMGAVRNDAGLCRIVLPHYAPDDLRALLAFEHPTSREDPGPFAELIARARAYFNAQPVGFDDVACDLPGEGAFTGKVLRICRQIPYGQTRPYSWLAKEAGNPEGARAAAAVMSRNQLPLVIPCHRVIYSNGRLGGFSSPAGEDQKRRMLQLEGAI